MLLLAFDTATPAVTVALHDGERALAETVTVDPRRHGELLAPSIAKVLADAGAAQADLTAVAAGVGPGPYTGLRVGLVTARVLGRTLGIPVHGVCTLDVIAHAALPAAGGEEFLVAADARRREVYWARYSASGVRLHGPEVGRPGGISGAASSPVAGQGGILYPDAFGKPLGVTYPSASVLARMVAGRVSPQQEAGEKPVPFPDLLAPEPLYLRRPDARVPGPPKRVTR
ncbi:MAG TPA: tRNA (adenosine(37)-N6)-threonylcarbamoyltransferase complex dimerization subunit type 1 TsaB [Streptosporangiaceae bacterium]|nr:tRNA (adenosine(37)-N6)-threonylcarbamoyltransferase complex dimerization subunit type 1 TsaB [Streptosporangiaceae bacterium]